MSSFGAEKNLFHMPIKTHEDPIFKEKRKPKNPIKFRISLNEEQKRAKEIILNSKVAILAGKAGSGKTLLACQIALDGLFTKQYEKIIITRPTVSKEEIGFLPGDLHQKMDPWVQPIYQNMYILYGKERVQPYIEKGDIEIVPLSFMRGRTFLDSAIIVDEAQNVTMEQMEMIVTRLGLRSKMMICGDDAQVDLKNRGDSGFKFLYSAARRVKSLEAITLLENHRDPIVDDLIDLYEEESLKRMPQKR
jgi:phosphate starvation-inducible PhoH-like protein